MITRLLSLFLLLTGLSLSAAAQTFPAASAAQGYEVRGDTTWFLFDPALYNRKEVEQVVVTGAFAGWSADMKDPARQLKPADGGKLWVLPFPNPEFRNIGVSSPFKFRINDGVWLDPHAAAPNADGGNLIFMRGIQPPRLTAEIRTARAIRADISGDQITRSLSPGDYLLKDAKGRIIPVAAVKPNTATQTLVVPAEDLDIRRVYYLSLPKQNLACMVSFDGWFRDLYSPKELGANVASDKKSTVFRIFTPRAELVRLYLYLNPEDKKAGKTVDMKRDAQGVWEATLKGDLKGWYYDFTVHGPDEPGNFFYETTPVHINDPYARVSLDTWGKARVWYRTVPATPLKNGIPKMEDVVAYEVHVQDFTELLPVSDDLKRTIPAMTLPGLRNKKGEKIGFDHLVDLGVNVVHLMPMQEYLHYPDEEWQAAFGQDPWFKEQGVDQENYDWGYRTTFPFAVESRYRRRGTEPGAERDQFRNLVQAFHDKGIAVVVDYVFNHTGENMDGRRMFFNFAALDLVYHYRTKNGKLIGEYGNETKSENRPMMQRWFSDQAKHWIDEFGVDGFRIDLAGQTDQQTLTAFTEAIGRDKIVYGEPWIASFDPDYEANPDWDWYKVDAPITFFQDDARNAFKGPAFFDPASGANVKGFSGGDTTFRRQAMLGLTNGFPEERQPNRGINYLDIHDNWALADQFALTGFDGRRGVDEGAVRIASTLLLTSLGPLVIHGGTEFMRSKGLAPLTEKVGVTRTGKIWLNGRRDTNTLRRANLFVWDDLGKTPQDESSYFPGENAANDYLAMSAWWKGLIGLRLSDAGKVFRQGIMPPDGYYQFITPANPYLLGYFTDGSVAVFINTGSEEASFGSVSFPAGTWLKVAEGSRIDPVNGIEGNQNRLSGGAVPVTVPPRSVKIWVKQ